VSRSTAPPHALQIDGTPIAVLPPANVDRAAVIADTRDWMDWCLGAGTADHMTLLDVLGWLMCADDAPFYLRLEAAAVLLPHKLGAPADHATDVGPVMRGVPRRH
jgi:hypothetical protein